MMRHIVKTFSGYGFEGTVQKLIDTLETLKAKYPDKELMVDFGMEPVAYEDYDRPEFKIYYVRQEPIDNSTNS